MISFQGVAIHTAVPIMLKVNLRRLLIDTKCSAFDLKKNKSFRIINKRKLNAAKERQVFPICCSPPQISKTASGGHAEAGCHDPIPGSFVGGSNAIAVAMTCHHAQSVWGESWNWQ